MRSCRMSRGPSPSSLVRSPRSGGFAIDLPTSAGDFRVEDRALIIIA